jgi:hypothetical protein
MLYPLSYGGGDCRQRRRLLGREAGRNACPPPAMGDRTHRDHLDGNLSPRTPAGDRTRRKIAATSVKVVGSVRCAWPMTSSCCVR